MEYRWTSKSDTKPKNPLNWTNENGGHSLPGNGDSVLIDTEAPGAACVASCDWGSIILDAVVILSNPKSGRYGIDIGQQVVGARTVSFLNARPIAID